ncbi:P-loop NTPase fold protein [Persephonella sp.]
MGFDEIREDFRGFLEKIENNAIVGLFGSFGMGKSTMLYQLRKEYEKEDPTVKWINFDAWKYPDKKDLWEGFVFTLIENTSILDKYFIKFISRATNILGFFGVSLFAFFKWPNIWGHIIYFLYHLPLIVRIYLGLSVLILLLYASCFLTSKTINDLHFFLKIYFKYILINRKWKKFIIIEDIDRAHEGGIFFLETLSYFLRNNQFKDKKIIAIVPLNKDYLEEKFKISSDEYYLKAIDYQYPLFQKLHWHKFIKEIIDLSLIKNPKKFSSIYDKNKFELTVLEQISHIFKQAINSGCSIRKIKSILRKSDNLYRQLSNEEKEEIDIRIWIGFSFFNYVSNNNINLSTINITEQNFLIYLFAIFLNDDPKQIRFPLPVKRIVLKSNSSKSPKKENSDLVLDRIYLKAIC